MTFDFHANENRTRVYLSLSRKLNVVKSTFTQKMAHVYSNYADLKSFGNEFNSVILA